MSIFNLLHLEPMLHTLTSVWTLAGELVTAGALLWCLNALARFIRLVYEAGRWTGWLWRTYLVPALLYLADSISWGVAQVDWLEVRKALRDYAVGTAVIVVLTAQLLWKYAIRSAVLTVRAVRTVKTVSFGVLTKSYDWVERNWIDIPQTDLPVQTVIRRTEGGRGIERSIARNEHPKSVVRRRRHGRLTLRTSYNR
tara:strand:- start:3126 stop:3716 length:591 start_codon:yes stop_codon:yes gene_type:complete